LTANRNSWEEGSNRLDRRRCGLSEFPNESTYSVHYPS